MIFNKKIFLNNINTLINDKCNGVARAFNEHIGQRDAVTRWKKNDIKPNFDAIIKICEVFDCSFDWLLTGKDHRSDTYPTAPDHSKSEINGKPNFCGDDWSDEEIKYCRQLKRILDSDNEIIKSAIRSNLDAFEYSVIKEKESKDDIEELKKRILHLEGLNDPAGYRTGTDAAES